MRMLPLFRVISDPAAAMGRLMQKGLLSGKNLR
jgi:hypothetical protein